MAWSAPLSSSPGTSSGSRVPRRRTGLATGVWVLQTGIWVVAAALAGGAGAVGCGREAEVGGAGRVGMSPAGAALLHVIVEGTPYEMGVHQGRLLRDEIRARVARPLPAAIADVLPGYAGPIRDLLPVGAADELRGIAAGAGVAEADLYAREIARDVLRWHVPDAALTGAAFASAPGDAPCVAVAYGGDVPALSGRFRVVPGAARDAREGRGPADLVLVERRPSGGIPTLVFAAPGSLGGIAGVSGRGIVAVAAEDGSRAPEQRSLRGAPFAVGLRFALERGADADAVVAALPKTLGHRVLVADAANARIAVLVALAGEDPARSPPTAWVLRPADGPDAAANAEAQDRKLGSYTARPGCADALDLAEAGLGPTPDGEQLLSWSRDGVDVTHVREAGVTATFGVRWARGAGPR